MMEFHRENWFLSNDLPGLAYSLTNFLEKDFPGLETSVGLPAPLHCHGLIMLRTATQTYVCNPVTRELVALPTPNQISSDESFGFGFDCSTNIYKVARFFLRSFDHKTRAFTWGLEVFTLGSSHSWRQIAENPPFAVELTCVACVGGGVYWKIEDPSSHSGILRFDLIDERFIVIHPPPSLSDIAKFKNEAILTELEGSLCCVHVPQDKRNAAHIWTTRDFDNHAWTLSYTINLPYVPPRFLPIAIDQGNVVLRCGYSLLFYNPQTGTMDIKIPMNGRNPASSPVISYVESMVPIIAS